MHKSPSLVVESSRENPYQISQAVTVKVTAYCVESIH